MYGQHRKVDPSRVMAFKRRGLSNIQIARRLGVTIGAIYYVLHKAKTRGEPARRQQSMHARRHYGGERLGRQTRSRRKSEDCRMLGSKMRWAQTCGPEARQCRQ